MHDLDYAMSITARSNTLKIEGDVTQLIGKTKRSFKTILRLTTTKVGAQIQCLLMFFQGLLGNSILFWRVVIDT
jgi:hypothetical protein